MFTLFKEREHIANIAIVLYGHREKHSDKPYSRLKLISVNPD